jgi:hypothetical protein
VLVHCNQKKTKDLITPLQSYHSKSSRHSNNVSNLPH